MSKNLYKAAWVVVSGDEKHVIDSNSLMEKRMEELEVLRRAGGQQPEEGYEGGDAEGFMGGLGAEAVDALLSDRDGGSGIIKAAPAEPVPDLEEIRAQAQQMIDDAQAHIDEMQQAAESEIEAKRRWAMEEGKKEGYGEGYRKGIAEADVMKQQLIAEKQQLEEEYERLIEELEPKFIDAITAVYSHIFGVELMDNRDILVHLVDSTLRQVESSRTFIVHVSKEDYPFVNMQKQSLAEGAAAGRGTVEIIEDITLGQGECMIETEGGIFDCGIDTQLTELNKKKQVLSYE